MVTKWIRPVLPVALLVLVHCPGGRLGAEEKADPPADAAKAARDGKADAANDDEAVWGFSLEGLKEIEQTPKETNAMREEVRKWLEAQLRERKFDELQWSERLSMEDLEFVLVKVRVIRSRGLDAPAVPVEEVYAMVFRVGKRASGFLQAKGARLVEKYEVKGALEAVRKKLELEAKESMLIQGRRLNVPEDSDPAAPKPEPDQPSARRWSDASGKVLATGDLTGLQVVVQSSDGQRTTVPLEKLSEADRQFVNDWLDGQEGPK